MKDAIEAEGTIELGKAVDLLEDLLRGLKQGSVHVEYGDKPVQHAFIRLIISFVSQSTKSARPRRPATGGRSLLFAMITNS